MSISETCAAHAAAVRCALLSGPKTTRTKAVYKRAIWQMESAAQTKAWRKTRSLDYALFLGLDVMRFLAHMERVQDLLDLIPASEMSDETKARHFTRLAKGGMWPYHCDLDLYAILRTGNDKDDFFDGLDLIFKEFGVYDLEDLLFGLDGLLEGKLQTTNGARVRRSITGLVQEAINSLDREEAEEAEKRRAEYKGLYLIFSHAVQAKHRRARILAQLAAVTAPSE